MHIAIGGPKFTNEVQHYDKVLGDRSVKTLIAGDVSPRVFNNSRETKQCRLIENSEQNNVGEISSRIARRVANLSGLIA
jgi:hypothetical protein